MPSLSPVVDVLADVVGWDGLPTYLPDWSVTERLLAPARGWGATRADRWASQVHNHCLVEVHQGGYLACSIICNCWRWTFYLDGLYVSYHPAYA